MTPVWLLFFITTVGCLRDIEFKHCKHTTGNLSCKVKAVQVRGCLNPSPWVDAAGSVVEYRPDETKNPCRIDHGSTLNFTISFEPGFSGGLLRSQFSLPDMKACWMGSDPPCPVNSPLDLGCEFTKCPLERGRQQPFETSLRVRQDLPARPLNDRVIYQLRWKLWNNKMKKNNCCFNIPIQY